MSRAIRAQDRGERRVVTIEGDGLTENREGQGNREVADRGARATRAVSFCHPRSFFRQSSPLSCGFCGLSGFCSLSEPDFA
jgi:hypothetical protein